MKIYESYKKIRNVLDFMFSYENFINAIEQIEIFERKNKAKFKGLGPLGHSHVCFPGSRGSKTCPL